MDGYASGSTSVVLSKNTRLPMINGNPYFSHYTSGNNFYMIYLNRADKYDIAAFDIVTGDSTQLIHMNYNYYGLDLSGDLTDRYITYIEVVSRDALSI